MGEKGRGKLAKASPIKKPAVLRRAGFSIRNIDRSGLDQRTSRSRALRAAARTTRFRLARRGALARAGQFFRLWRHRPFDIFEADLFLGRLRSCLVLYQDDADVAAALELAEQHFIRQGLLDVLLNHARHRPRAHLLVVTMLYQPSLGRL